MAGRSAVVKVAIVADNSSLTRGLKESQSRLAGFGKTVAKIGIAAGAAAGVGLAAFGKAAVDAASDAQQSIGATEAIYGKFAKSVIDSSNRAAEAVGLSSNEYRTNANLLGALLKNQGVATDQLAGKTNKLIKVGADLAATYGGTASDAVEALTSAFKGEFDPLEKYGISIKQSTINTEAFRIAGVKSQKAFNNLSTAQQTAAKRQATTNLIIKQSTDAHGAFARETDTLAHKQQVLAAQFENAKAKIGNALLPAITDLTQYLSSHAIPKLEEFGDWLNDHQAEIREFGDKAADTAKQLGKLAASIGQTLLPKLQALGELLLDIVGWFNDLPGPVKSLTTEVVLAAAAWYKFSPAVTGAIGSMKLAAAQAKQLAAEMTYVETRGTAVRSGLSKLGPIAKGAAGAGGLVALTTGAQQSNQGLKTLMDTAGGAMTGFAVAGPWGAAIGGAAGLLWSLKDAFGDTEQAAKDAARVAGKKDAWDAAKASAQELTDALHGTVAAYNKVTASAVQQGFRDADGQLLPWVKHLQDAGVNTDTLTRAILGQKDAEALLAQGQKQINTNLQARRQQYEKDKQAYEDYTATLVANQQAGIGATPEQIAHQEQLRDAVKDSSNAYKDYKADVDAGNDAQKKYGSTVQSQIELERRRRAELGLTKKQYDAMPKSVRTKVETEGAPQSKTSVLDFIKSAKLVPKQVISVLKATGTQISKAEAKSLKIEYDKLPRSVTTKAKFEKTGQAKSDAASYGADVADAFGAGYVQGIRNWTGPAEYAAAALAASAQAAAKHADQSRSPSRVMKKAGQDFGKGYAIGIESMRKHVATASEKLAKAAQAAVVNGSTGVANALAKVDKFVDKQLDKQYADRQASIKKRLDGKAEKAALSKLATYWKRHAKQVTKSLKDERQALIENGKKQDALASGNFLPYLNKTTSLYKDMVKAGVTNLADARQHLADLKQQSLDYAASVKDSFIAFGNITQLGQNDDGTVSLQNLLDQMSDRVVQAQNFQQNIAKLKGLGLDDAQLQQLVDAGPEAAGATSDAIAKGGADAVKAINDMGRQLAAAGGTLGNDLATHFYAAGIKTADGIVKGLTDKQDKLDAAATRMANALVKAVRKALGIKSPSAEFQSIGQNVSAGLALGINETYASSAGSGLANALVAGFGNPSLNAAAVGGGNRMQVEVRLTAQQVSQLERGRAIQVDLDAYRAAGGRGMSR